MSLTDQIILAVYDFLMGTWGKVSLGVLFVVLIIWAIGATRKHAYHYAMRGAGFGATSAVVTALVLVGAFLYLVVDRQMLFGIMTGKRSISDLPVLVASTVNRFQFVLGASTTESQPSSSQEVMRLIQKLPTSERLKLQVQTCQEVLKGLPH